MLRSIRTIAMLGLLTVAASAQTVSVALTSPQASQTVAPGATVEWSITFAVSQGDNEGLALLSADLVQAATNPALFNILPADGVPTAMNNFSRPAGVSNPGESNPTTGYIGVQRGTTGQKNLIQVGGGQNCTGFARPGGTGIAESANVVAGVGQGSVGTLASGSFQIPTTCGTYTFRLDNVTANVVIQRNNPGTYSPCESATVDTTETSFVVTVGLPADLDDNGVVEAQDLALLLAAFNTNANGDIDGDNDTDAQDLALLLSSWLASCP